MQYVFLLRYVNGEHGMDNEVQNSENTAEAPSSFTQEDVNRIVAERLAREKTKLEREKADSVKLLLTELGVESVESLRLSLETARDAERKNMSDLEVAQAEANEAKARLTAIQAELETTRLESQKAVVTSSMRSELQKLGVVDADTAVLLLTVDGVDSYLDGGTPNNTAINAAISALKDSKAFLFSQPSSYKGLPSSGGSVPSPNEDKEAARRRLREQVRG